MAFDESENVEAIGAPKTFKEWAIGAPKTFKEWAIATINGYEFEQVGEPKTYYEYALALKAGLDVEIPEGMEPKTFKEKVMAPQKKPNR